MKSQLYIIIFSLCAIAGMISCTQSEILPLPDEEGKQTGTAILSVATRSTMAGYSSTEEHIKTLRVIAVTSTRTVIANYYEDFFTDPTASGTVTRVTDIEIENIPFGETTFYVIANEASVGLDLSGLAKGEELPPVNKWEQMVIANHKEEVDGSITTFFPRLRRDIGDKGLPITGIHTENVNADTQDITIEITRAVAKVTFSFNNYAGADIPIVSLGLGQFIADHTYLFPQESTDGTISIPQKNTYTDHIFVAASEQGATIERGEFATNKNNEELLVYYFFETNNTSTPSPYTMGIETVASGIFMPPEEFIADQLIPRNTQVDVVANIYWHDETTKIEWEVIHFTEENVDVPPFN